MTTINTIIDQAITAFLCYGSRSSQFQSIYRQHEVKLNAHKRRVLENALDKPVTLTGVLQRRGDGEERNLNLISPAFVNGVKVEHLHVYDEVIDIADMDYDSGCFIASNCKIYKFSRKSRHIDTSGLGVKPSDCPVWSERNEWV